MARSFKTVCLGTEKKTKQHTIRPVAVLIYLILTGASSISNSALANSDIEFNADILDLKDKQNIDLSDFSRAGYYAIRNQSASVHVSLSRKAEEFLR